jgi:hypothetical protein
MQSGQSWRPAQRNGMPATLPPVPRNQGYAASLDIGLRR